MQYWKRSSFTNWTRVRYDWTQTIPV